jgi:hypothetical protein
MKSRAFDSTSVRKWLLRATQNYAIDKKFYAGANPAAGKKPFFLGH